MVKILLRFWRLPKLALKRCKIGVANAIRELARTYKLHTLIHVCMRVWNEYVPYLAIITYHTCTRPTISHHYAI